jgi:hypothetical protein
MRLPIDTAAVRFVTADPPEQAVDFDTKQPQANGEGQLIFNVPCSQWGPEAGTASPSRWPESPRASVSSPR